MHFSSRCSDIVSYVPGLGLAEALENIHLFDDQLYLNLLMEPL